MTAFDEGNYPAPSPLKPTAKVAAAGASGAVTLLLVYVARLLGLEVPPEVAAAVTLLLTFAAGYLKRDPHA